MTLTAKLKIWRSNPIGETCYPLVLAGLYLADYVRELRGRYDRVSKPTHTDP